MTQSPLSWLKQVVSEQIKSDLTLAKQIPLWGAPPLFPWTSFSQELQNVVGSSDVSIALQSIELIPPSSFFSSLGQSPFIRFLELSPLKGHLVLLLAEETCLQVSSLLLSSDSPKKGLSDSILQEGFFTFLLLQATECFEQCKAYPTLHPQWLEEDHPLPQEMCYAVNLSLSLKGHTFLIRLLVPPDFHYSFSSHFQANPDPLRSPLISSLQLIFKLEVGTCLLLQKRWQTVQVGDFLILDTCTYDPSIHKGTLQLSLEEIPLFKVKVKKNKLKILDYYIPSEGKTMADNENYEEDFTFDEESSPEEHEEEEGHLSPSLPLEKKEAPLSSPLEIPFPLRVEVDRIQMPLGKLLALEPGNILDLSVQPEQGVYLTVHGKRIARGELIKIGDALGVKIVELGDALPS